MNIFFIAVHLVLICKGVCWNEIVSADAIDQKAIRGQRSPAIIMKQRFFHADYIDVNASPVSNL